MPDSRILDSRPPPTRPEDGRFPWADLLALRGRGVLHTALTLGLVFLGPVLVAATFLSLGPLGLGAASRALRLILLGDLVYVLLVAALVMARVARMIADRRSRSAGSRLHLRLTGVFAGVALVPTVLVAVFAVLSVNLGLEGWFSDRVRSVVGASLAAAEAYESEQRSALDADIGVLADFLDRAREQSPLLRSDELRPLLHGAQDAVKRSLKEAFLVDGTGALRARGEHSYLFDLEPIAEADLARARAGETATIPDWENNEYRALKRLDAFPDLYLYVSRDVDGRLLSLLDETQATVRLYNQLDSERGRLLLNFGLIYLGFALILILAAIWLGLWFAERLARPVGRLAGAAERVGEGDLDVQLPDEKGDDEIALVGRQFNRMTRQLREQRLALIQSHARTEERRRLFDSVLSNVTAGVIGLDAQGMVDFVNPAGMRLLDLGAVPAGQPLVEVAPEFAPLVTAARDEDEQAAQEEIRLARRGQIESLLVRISERRTGDGGLEGYVVAFDNVTDLLTAQRMAAWGEVARRIAHEIKNPLTPIALSAERLKRKFRSQVQDVDDLEALTGVIVRQTDDLRRIVDEFSRFARMPEPDRREHDLARLVRDALTLQESGQPGVRFSATLPDEPVVMDIDATMIAQALTNLIKNAGEATESLIEKGAPEGYRPEIRLSMEVGEGDCVIRIMDNGIGLPEDRTRLFEPYVTTRARGTGLGLPIVRKIIEEHGGTLALVDAPVFGGGTHAGAMAEVRLPRLARRRGGRNRSGQGQMTRAGAGTGAGAGGKA